MTRGRNPQVSDDLLVELVATCDSWAGRPVTTADEVATWLDVARQSAWRRLQRLYENGPIEKYKPGQAAVWWVERD
jgi:hypothetical protein